MTALACLLFLAGVLLLLFDVSLWRAARAIGGYVASNASGFALMGGGVVLAVVALNV